MTSQSCKAHPVPRASKEHAHHNEDASSEDDDHEPHAHVHGESCTSCGGGAGHDHSAERALYEQPLERKLGDCREYLSQASEFVLEGQWKRAHARYRATLATLDYCFPSTPPEQEAVEAIETVASLGQAKCALLSEEYRDTIRFADQALQRTKMQWSTAPSAALVETRLELELIRNEAARRVGEPPDVAADESLLHSSALATLKELDEVAYLRMLGRARTEIALNRIERRRATSALKRLADSMFPGVERAASESESGASGEKRNSTPYYS